MARDDLPSFPTPSEAFANSDMGNIPPPPQQRFGRGQYTQSPPAGRAQASASGQGQVHAPQPQFHAEQRAPSPSYRQQNYRQNPPVQKQQPPPQQYGYDGYSQPYANKNSSQVSHASHTQQQHPSSYPQNGPSQYGSGSSIPRSRRDYPASQQKQYPKTQAQPSHAPVHVQQQHAPQAHGYPQPSHPHGQQYYQNYRQQPPQQPQQQQPQQQPQQPQQFSQPPPPQDYGQYRQPSPSNPYQQPQYDGYQGYNSRKTAPQQIPQQVPTPHPVPHSAPHSGSHSGPHTPQMPGSLPGVHPAYEQDYEQASSPSSRSAPAPKRAQDLRQIFDGVDRDKNGFLTEAELSRALVNGDYTKFHPNTVRMMLRMFDRNHDGALYFDEFTQLWKYLRDWRSIFQRFDTDRSECITLDEFSVALDAFGYTLSKECVGSLFSSGSRSGTRGGRGYEQEMSFDMFVQTCINIKTITDIFKAFDTDRDGQITISFEDFLKNVNQFNAPSG